MKYLVVLFLLAPALAMAQKPDPALLAAIRGIRAIDNHSHPPALVAAGQKDDEFDALPCDPLEPTDPALSSRPDNPRFLAAWKALYGYKYSDADSAHLRELLAAKQSVKLAQGDNYPAWVLDKLGIETELAESRGARPRSHRAALPLGAVRRRALVSARQHVASPHTRRTGRSSSRARTRCAGGT